MFSLDITNLTKQRVPRKALAAAAVFAAKRLRLQGELSVVLSGDQRLRTLNRTFRGRDKATDILTFASPKETPGALGEIFINLQDCRRPRKYQEVLAEKKSFVYLLFFLLIHGLLHLAGGEDETESGRQRMIAQGKKLMAGLREHDIIKGELLV